MNNFHSLPSYSLPANFSLEVFLVSLGTISPLPLITRWLAVIEHLPSPAPIFETCNPFKPKQNLTVFEDIQHTFIGNTKNQLCAQGSLMEARFTTEANRERIESWGEA